MFKSRITFGTSSWVFFLKEKTESRFLFYYQEYWGVFQVFIFKSETFEKKLLKIVHIFCHQKLFFCFNKKNIFTLWRHFFVKRGTIVCQKVLLSVIFLYEGCQSTIFLLNFIIFHVSLLSFKNLFQSIDLFILALWSFLVKKGASFTRSYFFLIGPCLLKMRKIDSLNRPKFVSFKEQKLWLSDLKASLS